MKRIAALDHYSSRKLADRVDANSAKGWRMSLCAATGAAFLWIGRDGDQQGDHLV